MFRTLVASGAFASESITVGCEVTMLNLGTVVTGTFHCRKSAEDFRALDVEFHYVVRDSEVGTGKAASPPMIVQSFKVR